MVLVLCFQIVGMMLCSQEWLQNWVIADIALWPMFFRCILDILSGHVAFKFFKCVMALWVFKRGFVISVWVKFTDVFGNIYGYV